MTDFDADLAEAATATDAVLERLLAPARTGASCEAPDRLLAAMRYAALSPGKRLRPFLLIQSARLFGQSGAGVFAAAAALECVHAYSLVHDDLPAMDDDDMRRGRPTVHRAFDEATAILAGDSLLTLAFETIAGPDTDPDPAIRTELTVMLARAAGAAGMAGGQQRDLEAEGTALDEDTIRALQAMKTGALIRFACEAGAVLGRASPDERSRLAGFGARLGLAFQLADDLLDLTATPAATGKATAKDAARGKATLVARRGIAGARALLAATIAEAIETLAPFAPSADSLRAAARFAAERQR